MSSAVKSLEVTYNPINESNTFTNRDYLTGQVTLEVTKDCQINSLFVKFKGKAEVRWMDVNADINDVYHAQDKYFSVRHYFIGTNKKPQQRLVDQTPTATYSSVVAPGRHVYPFTFQIPYQVMPSSFKGSVGKIVYLLEATLSRSMKMDQKASTKINFVSKIIPSNLSWLMKPQQGSKDKKMSFFTSGTVAMDVKLEKTGFYQGEGLKVFTSIQNNSSREIKPKYCVYRKHSFFARGKRKVDTKDLVKEVGDPIPPNSKDSVTRVIAIPPDVEPSILNCNIIKVEHRLRVYLDVKYASNPEIKFDIVFLRDPEFPAVAPPPAADDAGSAGAAGFSYEPFENPNPPAWGFAPPQAPAAPLVPQPSGPPPPYAAYGMYPPLNDFGQK